MKVRWGRMVAFALGGAWAVTAIWQTHKALPPGLNVASPVCTVAADTVAFLTDTTAADAYGRPVVKQGVFDEAQRLVRAARRFVVLDYELLGAQDSAAQRRLTASLTEALLERRQAQPDLQVLFITDPVNEGYGTTRSARLALLRAAGVQVVLTDLDALRDPNFLYSSLWRLTLRWWDPARTFGADARALNFKRSHRKVLIADDGHGGLTALVGSANPDDSQETWSNAALRLSGGAVRALLASELAIAHFSGWRGPGAPFAAADEAATCDAAVPAALSASGARVQVLTEGAIRREFLQQLGAAARGDAVDVAMFKLADRGVVEALLEAARRGVHVRLILDPSEDATTLAPSGLPNQPAGERAGVTQRRRPAGALVPHPRRALPQRVRPGVRPRAPVADGGFGEPHAAQPR